MAARSTGELKTYNAKRRFGVTTEPKGKVGRKSGHAFVIQKHDATRLHYDLRLELDGVTKSWAVTRGPSLVPGEKRLAVQVEDHPIEYNKFEGLIPEGEYGGGTVMIWDRGTWEPEGDPHEGLTKGHLSFTLDGEKLHGGWHLVRMHRRPNEKRDNWLLIKQHDEAERGPRDKDILEDEPLSVVTGRSLDEIAAGATRRARKAKSKPKATVKKSATKKTTAKRKKTASNRAAVIKPLRKSAKARDDDPDIEDAPVGVLPGFVEPCLATLSDKAPDGDAWVHEIKFDGYRLQARLDRGKVKLLTRHGLDWTAKFPAVAQAVAKLAAKTALIDGEVVVEGENGVSSFSLLQQALSSGEESRMAFYAFDLIHLDGTDLRPLPLTTRKAALGKLLARVPRRGPLRLSESIDERGPVLLKRACGMGLEGIISKLAMAGYHSGRSHDWLKTKCSDRQEFVVAGFVPSTADARAIGALVLAFYDNGKLRYAGRTGTGFSHEVARDLYRTLTKRTMKTSPFGIVPVEERGRRRAIWVEPKMVVEVDFRGWTHGDRVRQASFQGVREDKKATEVVREKKTIAARAATAVKRSAPAKKRADAKPSRTAETRSTATKNDDMIGAVKLTHPDRVYWQDAGVTKRDLAEYYIKVWDWMSPHLVGRAVALVRCPEGADFGQCFFQKHVTAGLAPTLLHLVPEKGEKIISVDRLDGLISLVQAGVLEIHTRGSTIEHLDMADRLVFDLDPGPGTTFADVVAAARDVRERLEGIKLTTFVKTTGGKGLHVVLPIKPASWDDAKAFTRTVAAAMEADTPEKYVATATKSKRNGRIFIDYLRNSREATAIAPYSTRARDGAPVSVPIDWSELGALKGTNAYTVKNITQRLSRLRKDPWADIGKVKQSLPKFK
ncbi:DNA ligase D [Microbacteriaceae bacterium K1510]|nr:DNA ligase D [Microbacteriaceae bacterium K1510]